MITASTSVVYHLAAIVGSRSACGERFPSGWKVSWDLTASYLRRVVATENSFISARLPFMAVRCRNASPIPPRSPRSRYGAQRRYGLLVNDYTLPQGYVDGLALRLPAISVFARVNQPRRFFFYQRLIREPLRRARTTVCPVSGKFAAQCRISSPAAMIP